MFRTLRATVLGLSLLAGTGAGLAAQAAHQAAHWGYFNDIGPSHWSDLSSDYATCKNGRAQSPINIGQTRPAHPPPLWLRYRATGLELVNNGHTVQVNVQPGSEIMLGGKAYELKQFHFHTPSEHTLDGRPLPMEIHFVHQATDGGIAVIGVLVRNSYRPHPILRRLWRYLPAHPGDHNDAGGLRINPVALLPPHRNYVTYTGSLTTPPCSEGVHWIVMLTPLRTIRQEVDLFAHLIGDNARPVQPLNGRTVLGTRQRR